MPERHAKTYYVAGPFSVQRNSDGDFAAQKNEAYAALAGKYGCYIYATRWGEVFTPWYAGRTKRSFEKEIFTSHKQQKLNDILAQIKNGELVVFLIVPETLPVGQILNLFEKWKSV